VAVVDAGRSIDRSIDRPKECARRGGDRRYRRSSFPGEPASRCGSSLRSPASTASINQQQQRSARNGPSPRRVSIESVVVGTSFDGHGVDSATWTLEGRV
jgi:hypothetical protein